MTRTFLRGFTLIEVIVVLSILSVLVALLLPVLSRARDAARVAQAASNLHQIGVALELYRSDNDGEVMYGRAYEMGLPTELSLYGGPVVPEMLIGGTNGLWSSPCGQHSDTPPAESTGTNLGYFPSDLDEEPWRAYVEAKGGTAIVAADSNCNPADVPLSAAFYKKLHLGLGLDGHVEKKVVSTFREGFLVWLD